MSDDRTDDQKHADAAFEDAIRTMLTAYGEGDGFLMEWVLCTAQHRTDDDGTQTTAVGAWLPTGKPLFRTLGLLDYVQARERAIVAGNADLDDL